MTWGVRTLALDHPKILAVRVGPTAVSLRVSGPEEAASLAVWLQEHDLPGVEVVPAATTVLVDGVDDLTDLREFVRGWSPSSGPARCQDVVTVPVSYDGADLERIARRWEVGVDEVIARHTGLEFVATFGGFSPGFSYLAGLPVDWALPRLDSPRPRVPAGSVALAQQWCGIYPTSSPGGWWLLGRTRVPVWDPDRTDAPALLVPGTRVRFVVA